MGVSSVSDLTGPAEPRAEEEVPDLGRQRLLAILQRELARASAEALARGVPKEALADYLSERMSLLLREIAGELEVTEDAVGEDVAHDLGDPVELRRVVD